MDEPGPRHQCWSYFLGRGLLPARKISKKEFDKLALAGDFDDGPHRDTFGDGYGEPYYPYRQAFGTLNPGDGVYCELREGWEEK